MKKLLFALFSGIVMSFLFASCHKYEESMYNKSDYQIKYIWYKTNSGDPNETFNYDKKKMLTSINILDTSDINYIRMENFDFTYNKDKTVKSISHTSDGISETVSFSYLNRYVKYMTYSINGEIRMVSNFFRDDEKSAKITRITEIFDRQFFEDMQLLKKTVLFPKFVGNLERVSDLATANTKELTLYCEKKITYEGENIVSIEESYPTLLKAITTTMTYGDVLNPYYGLNYCYSNDLLGFSKNALASKTVTTYIDGVLSYTEQTDYQYTDINKDKYPRMFTYTSSNNPGIHLRTYITYVSEYK